MQRDARLVKFLLVKRGMSVAELGRRSRVAASYIYSFLKGRTDLSSMSRSRLAIGLGEEFDVVADQIILPLGVTEAMISGYGTEEAKPGVKEKRRFTYSVAAGDWADIAGLGEDTPADLSAEEREFEIRIAGKSMEPDWRELSVVEFCTTSVDKLSPGQDVYVQREDGKATFKRVKGFAGRELQLLSLSGDGKKKPVELHVRREKIVCVAVARSI